VAVLGEALIIVLSDSPLSKSSSKDTEFPCYERYDGTPGVARDREGSQYFVFTGASSLLVGSLHILEEFGIRVQASLAHTQVKTSLADFPALRPHIPMKFPR
jgi:hypothetical protein